MVEGGGAYSLVKLDKRTVASVRNRNTRVTLIYDGSAESIATIAAAIATAAATKAATTEEPKES